MPCAPASRDGSTAARVEILEDRDWSREWMQHYRPMRFGERLWICPSWLEPPEPDAVNLLLDPGLAFGTGTHPTTAMCLAAVDGRVRPGSSVVDYGCGSGVLGVAAHASAPRGCSPSTTTPRP
jgi:ribosomal protein L11 methyltransferase